ncbi:MAG: hypothetical protein Tsb0020_17250 [Haliangiales bacterium]
MKDKPTPPGFAEAMRYPLMESIFNRRTRRVMRGIKQVAAGSLSYSSSHDPQPLTALEEAVLISVISRTGRYTPPDRPFQDRDGKDILGSPNTHFTGRAAGSGDNGQMTYFFMMNDSGVYFLDHRRAGDVRVELTPDSLLENAERIKVKVADERIEFPRRYPYYLDSNRFLSNLPGSTIFMPIIEATRHYINMLMYVLQFPDDQRPIFLDELNGFRPFAPQHWIDSGFLSSKVRVPLSAIVRFRTDVEVHLLLQNLSLATQALGLGGWIHASLPTRHLLGHPNYTSEDNRGLGFRWLVPDRSPLPDADLSALAHPVGLDGLIEGWCPPYYSSMSDAVDACIEAKYAEGTGTYGDATVLNKIFKPGLAEKYMSECPPFSERSIACAKEICENIYETHGRFPPPLVSMDAISTPGIWLQAHHLDLDYYDELFNEGYADSQRDHQKLWHDEPE